MSEQCRSRDSASRLQCELIAQHDGMHRCETGEPWRILSDGSGYAPMAVWS